MMEGQDPVHGHPPLPGQRGIMTRLAGPGLGFAPEVVTQHSHPATHEVKAVWAITMDAHTVNVVVGNRGESFDGIGPGSDLAAVQFESSAGLVCVQYGHGRSGNVGPLGLARHGQCAFQQGKAVMAARPRHRAAWAIRQDHGANRHSEIQ